MQPSYAWMATPVGRLRLCANEHALTAILWEQEQSERVAIANGLPYMDNPLLQEAERQLAEYFAGMRTCFSLPLEPAGTAFQKQVWTQLLAIPYGQTRSYGELAQALGDTKLTRAVGAANGRNPLSIVVPCHRVVGSAGSLVGFAGGLAAKAWLLQLEGREQGLFDAAR